MWRLDRLECAGGGVATAVCAEWPESDAPLSRAL